MELKELEEKLEEYVNVISRIRVLSAVQMGERVEAEQYSIALREDYQEIGELGLRSRKILQETVYPFLEQKEPISFSVLCVLQKFCEMLLEPASGEELDLLLLFEISTRLLEEFRREGEPSWYVRQLHIHINVCYANVNRTSRISVTRTITAFYRDSGLAAAHELCGYVFDKERFLKLDMETRTQAIRGVRFYSALYDTFFAEPDANRERFQALVDAFLLAEDPFYVENLPDYPWKRHCCRCVEHMGQLTERGNRWGFSAEQCEMICGWLERLEQMRREDEETVTASIPEFHYRLIFLRNTYFAGRMEKKEYRDALLSLYETYRSNSYDMYAVQVSLLLPAEYLATFRGEKISAKTEAVIHRIYDQIIDYLLNSVNMDAFNYLQEYLVAFLDEFIELPDIMTFEDMLLCCLAALHPPTYVHCMQVADISKCLAEFLIRKNPKLFIREDVYPDAAAVEAGREEILQYIYHAALCHDCGKITMIDTIFIYGRGLLDSEFAMIKMHPKMGAELLQRYDSTRAYAPVAEEHHIWFNGEYGYPSSPGRLPSVVSCIVEIADSIDAATDSIGRSYSRGKTLSDICRELREDSGTHYAPYVVELLDDPAVLEDVDTLLTFGRENNYRNTFLLLNGVRERL